MHQLLLRTLSTSLVTPDDLAGRQSTVPANVGHGNSLSYSLSDQCSRQLYDPGEGDVGWVDIDF